MAKRNTNLTPSKGSRHSKKTKKRLAIKRAMLEEKRAKQNRRRPKSSVLKTASKAETKK